MCLLAHACVFGVLIACASAMPVQRATGADLILHFTDITGGDVLLVDEGTPTSAYLCGGKQKFIAQCGKCVSSEQCIAGFCCPYRPPPPLRT